MLIQQYDVGLIIFAASEMVPEERARLLNMCVDLNVRMLLISDMMRALQFWLKNSGKTDDKPTFVVE
jgi:hypothetical protein